MTGPVALHAGIRYPGDTGKFVVVQRTVHHFSHGRARAFNMSIGIHRLFKQRAQIS